MHLALALAALVSAVDPFEVNDPFPLPATYDSVLHEGKASLNLGYRGIFENYEIDGFNPRPYEQWKFFNEVDPFVRYSLSKAAEFKAGARIVSDMGGETRVVPRVAYIDSRPSHTFIVGNFRADWNPGLLYHPVAEDDHAGLLMRYGRKLRFEAFVSRPDAVGNDRYERYLAAGRVGLNHPVLVLEAQGLIDHAAGFDTAGLPYRRPALPTHQLIQTGLYGELNFLGRKSGLHAEVQHTSGDAVWEGKRWKPHGRYRAFGGHATLFNLTAAAEYRRVDPTFVAPAGALEYRLRYPEDRHKAPDAVVGKVRWFYPFHENASVLVDIEQVLFTQKRTLRVEANQNRATMALQVAF